MSDPKKGIGGAPTRATTLPDDPKERKKHPIASGLMDYFPDALVAVSAVSWKGNEQHNPGEPLHWARSKSTDEADTMLRHFLQRGSLDTDGTRHSAKMVWRALALLQKEIEGERDSNSEGSGGNAPLEQSASLRAYQAENKVWGYTGLSLTPHPVGCQCTLCDFRP